MLAIKNNTSGFTLVELMIAMTIFSMMTIMVMTIYLSTTDTTRRLNAERQLAETAREIVERIGEDVREKGMSGETAFDTTGDDFWRKYDYTGSGSEFLNLKNGYYVYGIKTTSGMERCTGTKKTDPKVHCGLYFVEHGDNIVNGYNLVDSFVAEESQKRVKIEDMKFYVSTDGVFNTQKVMMRLDLALMQKNGITASLASVTKLHIQTTLSERGWKQ